MGQVLVLYTNKSSDIQKRNEFQNNENKRRKEKNHIYGGDLIWKSTLLLQRK